MTTPGMQGEVSLESMGKMHHQPSLAHPTRSRPLPAPLGTPRGTKSPKTLPRKAVRSMERVAIGKSKRKSRLKQQFAPVMAQNDASRLCRRKHRFGACSYLVALMLGESRKHMNLQFIRMRVVCGNESDARLWWKGFKMISNGGRVTKRCNSLSSQSWRILFAPLTRSTTRKWRMRLRSRSQDRKKISIRV